MCGVTFEKTVAEKLGDDDGENYSNDIDQPHYRALVFLFEEGWDDK